MNADFPHAVRSGLIVEAERPSRSRTTAVILVVLVIHGLGLWVLQTGLLTKLAEVVVPVFLQAVPLDAPRPPEPHPPQPAPVPPKPAPKPPASPAEKTPPPAPLLPLAPAPELPVATVAAAAPAHISAISSAGPPPMAPAIATPGPAASPSPKVELPSSNADYLDNPRPAYPATSRRFGEQGTVQVRVYISAEGLPTRAEIRQSSGFERLDQAAVTTVLKWRFVPGKRGGVPEAMWVTVPINFVLE